MAEGIPDETLVVAFNRGDESAFDAILTRHTPPVSALVRRLLGWSGDVEDVTQDVFLAAYLNLKGFRGQCSLRTWLFTITLNKCRAWRRRHLVRQRLLVGLSTRRESGASPVAANEERMEAVSRALARLPGKYREPVILYYLEELSIDQIGIVLHLKPNAVHVRLNRARQQLKALLAGWESTL